MNKAILLLTLTAAGCLADTIYDNTANDQQFSVFYSTGYTQIGDQLQLTSAAILSNVDAQFFNDGSDATFDAVLQFYNVGGPVGSEIGGPFIVSNIPISSNTSQTVTFAGLNLAVPQDVIATLSVLSVSTGGDIGVNFFDPVAEGHSDDTFFIVNTGTGFEEASTNLNIDNIYFLVDGAPGANVPEPAYLGILLCGFALMGLNVTIRRRGRTYN